MFVKKAKGVPQFISIQAASYVVNKCILILFPKKVKPLKMYKTLEKMRLCWKCLDVWQVFKVDLHIFEGLLSNCMRAFEEQKARLLLVCTCKLKVYCCTHLLFIWNSNTHYHCTVFVLSWLQINYFFKQRNTLSWCLFKWAWGDD